MVRSFVGETLPDYMVSSFCGGAGPVAVDAEWHTRIGRALPGPDYTSGQELTQPATPTEAVLCGPLPRGVGFGPVGTNQSFFDLEWRLGCDAVDRPDQHGPEFRTVGARAVFTTPYRRWSCGHDRPGNRRGTRLRLARRERPALLPLSAAQSRLWFIDQLEGPSATYNIPMALCLTGRVDVVALEQSLMDVITRHEVLRTVFPAVDGSAHQHVLDPDRIGSVLVTVRGTPDQLNHAIEIAAQH